MAIELKQGQAGITPRDLIGPALFNELERVLRKHLVNIGNPPKAGEFPCLVFGQMAGGSVTKIKFPAEWQ
ncbi:MAG: hypothetical protein U9R20_05315 [Thermodesulfobacteriota bacterium]|nr:hypothetical protein [Thermodesulfobacteriota bacterium]